MSLTRALLSGVSESSLDLSEYDFSRTASIESYFLDAACESLLQDIYNVDKAFMVADVVGEVQVIKEGADPSVLLEGIVKDAFTKLKEGFKKFLAKIKEWYAKVKKFFQVLFMNGKELVKKYGKEIRDKSVKGFKYKGYNYKVDEGNKAVEKISETVSDEISNLLGNMSASNFAELNDDEQVIRAKNISRKAVKADGTTMKNINGNYIEMEITSKAYPGLTGDISTTDYQDRLVKYIGVKGATDYSEMSQAIEDIYRDGDTEKFEIEEFEANDRDEMIDFLSTFDKAIKDANNKEKKFESDVNAVVKTLDKVSNMTDTFKSGGSNSYQLASKISRFISGALSVRKTACDIKVKIYKEINSSWTSVLKSFVLKREVKESAFFEDFDNMISLTEAADVEPDVPDPEDGETGEGDSATKEGCKKSSCESASLLESAYNYL